MSRQAAATAMLSTFSGLKERIARKAPAASVSALYHHLEPKFIRLVTLHHGQEASPIQCSLHEASLQDHDLQYLALSWTWGPETAHQPSIEVNDEQLQIRPSLLGALLALRKTDTDLVFWIDAICINQTDDTEKATQIPLMTEIYAQAETVVIWLGQADFEDTIAMKYAAKLSPDASGMNDFSEISIEIDARRPTHISLPVKWFLQDLGKSLSDIRKAQARFGYRDIRIDECVIRLLSKDWFNRIWILQELALAERDPVVVCGASQVEWSLLMSALALQVSDEDVARYMMLFAELTTQFKDLGYHAFREAALGDPDTIDKLLYGLGLMIEFKSVAWMTGANGRTIHEHTVNTTRSFYQDGHNVCMLDAIVNSKWQQCTDSRDRVYGVLGFLASCDREDFLARFPISYAKSWQDVYIDATIFMLTSSEIPGRLFIYESFSVHPSSNSDLPSWVANFQLPLRSPGRIRSHRPRGDRSTLSIAFSSDRLTLCTDGIHLGSIDDNISFSQESLRTSSSKVSSLLLRYCRCTINYLLAAVAYTFAHYAIGDRSTAIALAKIMYHRLQKFSCLLTQISHSQAMVNNTCGASNAIWEILSAKEQSNILGDDREMLERLIILGGQPWHMLFRPDLVAVGSKAIVAEKLYIFCENLSFFICDANCYGFASGQLRKGDRVALLFPPQMVPFIIRPKGQNYEMVGIAYLPTQMRHDAIARAGDDLVRIHLV